MLPTMERPNAILKSEFVNISHLTGKKVKTENNKLTAILLCCNYCLSFEDFSILIRESNDFKLKIMESLLIARESRFLFVFRAILI